MANAALYESLNVALAIFNPADKLDEFWTDTGAPVVSQRLLRDAQETGDFGLREKFCHC